MKYSSQTVVHESMGSNFDYSFIPKVEIFQGDIRHFEFVVRDDEGPSKYQVELGILC